MHCLILCTGNSARSQMAEALLNARGAGRVVAKSAGSTPAIRVNPHAVRALAEIGIPWDGRTPRGIGDLASGEWDVVITVCDHARDACPVFHGAPVMAHWGMADPAAATGSDDEKFAAFREARDLIARRVDRMLALDLERLDSGALADALDGIGRTIA